MSTSPLLGPNKQCFCGKPGCTGTQFHETKVIKHLLPAWHAAIKNARKGFDEALNNQRAAELTDQISAELAHCTGDLKRHCAELGIHAGEPIHVGERDLSR